jgi:hypothetical protein
VVKPVFQDDTLVNGFMFCLSKNGLLKPNEHSQFSHAKPLIALYAMTAMHQCRIALDSGPPAVLMADRHTSGGTLVVIATAACPTKEIPTLHVAVPIFVTSLLARDWCEQALLDGDDQTKWEFAIELASDQKLTRIG